AACRRPGEGRRGAAPPRLRSVDEDLLGEQALCAQLLDRVVCIDDSHRARRGAKDHRLRVRVHVLVANSLQQLSGGDAGGSEEDVLARAKVVEVENLIGVVAFLDGDLALLGVANVELRLHVATDRLDGARREYAFGRAAGTHHAMDAESRLERSLESPGDIAGGDQLDARPHVTDLS